MSFPILSITDTTQLSELCATVFPSIWTTKRKQTTFKLFIQKVLKSTQLSCTCILVGLYYIQQLRFAYPSIHPPNGSEVRLLTTAFVLANKYLEDSPFTNKTWSNVSGISIKELNIMEIEFLSALSHNISISQKQFNQWTKQCQHLWSPSLPCTMKRSNEEEYGSPCKKRSIETICKPILSWSSSVSALTSSRIMNYTTTNNNYYYPF